VPTPLLAQIRGTWRDPAANLRRLPVATCHASDAVFEPSRPVSRDAMLHGGKLRTAGEARLSSGPQQHERYPLWVDLVFEGSVVPPDPIVQLTIVLPFATLVNGATAVEQLRFVRGDSLRLSVGELEMPHIQATRKGDNALGYTDVPAFALLTTADLQ